MGNVAIVLGAGSGTRMKIDKSKLLLEINGKTVIERSVEAFLDIDGIDRVVVTAREFDIEQFSKLINDEKVSFVVGGSTRQESVKNAVMSIDNADLVIVHDGARPLVLKEDIEKTIESAKEFGACAVGVPVKDTIKVIDDNSIVTSTPDRSKLFAVQTPQIFDFELYKKALSKAEKDKVDFTDDCQLVEYIGGKVKMVQGSYDNIKITTPDDVPLAENILRNRG